MDKTEKEIVIEVKELKKRYQLGRFGADTLQGTIKEWKEYRKSNNKAARNRDFYALDGVSFTVRKGEKIGILGRNGAGKSTLLKILSRITAPTEGCIDIYGRITSMLEVGTGFHADMTGRENIYLNGAILGMTKSEIDKKIDDIIEFSEIGEFIDTPIKRYSSGMFVKLGFAVAFHLDSEIIIMDEVLAVGDTAFQKKCISNLLKTAQEDDRTVLYVSHNMSTVRQLCDRCIVLDKGKLVFDGDTSEAISIYMGVDSALPSEVEYSIDNRPYDHIIRKEMMFTIEKLGFENCVEPVFFNSDECIVELTCKAEKELKDIGFRFELWYRDGTKIGSWMAGNLVDFPKGRSSVKIRFNMSHLQAGHYYADIVAFMFDGTSCERMIDAVYPGFSFEIQEKSGMNKYLDWNNKFWGVFRLDDLSIEHVRKIDNGNDNTD